MLISSIEMFGVILLVDLCQSLVCLFSVVCVALTLVERILGCYTTLISIANIFPPLRMYLFCLRGRLLYPQQQLFVGKVFPSEA